MTDQKKAGEAPTRPLGHNAKRLIAIKMARNAIPDGGGFEDGLRFLSNKDLIVASAKEAAKWVADAIDAVRAAAEPNPFKSATDEEIAGEILHKIESRKQEQAL